MGGVDRNAQMRANYSIKRPTAKYWLNIFEFLIEFAVQNAFRQHHMYFSTVEGELNQFAQKTHKQFIEDLATTLIYRHAGRSRMRNASESASEIAGYPAKHVFGKLPKRRDCWSCAENNRRRPKRPALEAIDPNVLTKRQKTARSQTSFQCATCKRPCCKTKLGEENQCWAYLHRWQQA